MIEQVSRRCGSWVSRPSGCTAEHFTRRHGGGWSLRGAGSAAAPELPCPKLPRLPRLLRSARRRPPARVRAEVTVLMDGRRRTFTMRMNDETVLDAAARAGLELPFSCRAGVCSTCRTKVVRGEVEMAQNYALEDWELEQGYVLACQARVKTPVARARLRREVMTRRRPAHELSDYSFRHQWRTSRGSRSIGRIV